MRRIIIVLTLLSLLAGQLSAAGSTESRRFNEAAGDFRAAIWERAEKKFGDFVSKYPDSTNVSEAILLQAEARIKMGRLEDATKLLSDNWSRAGNLADEYLYWTGETFFQQSNYTDAAMIFARLAEEYPASRRRLEAALGEASAEAKLGNWPRVLELLNDPKGTFEAAARARGASKELIFRGGLLLAEAQMAGQDYHAAESLLNDLAESPPNRQLNWQRQYLLCRVQLADERPDDALQSAQKLPVLEGMPSRRAESVALRANILEHLGRTNDAISAYQGNVGDETPAQYQQQAFFKIADLSLSLGKLGEATQRLESYLRENTNSPAASVVLFTLGDLQLKKFLSDIGTNEPLEITNSDALNLLRMAEHRFETLLEKYPGSALAGKAWLNKGWCLWFSADLTNSQAAFKAAANQLPPSPDQLVARFKWAEVQSRLKDFAGAITNYSFVVTHARGSSDPQSEELVEPALYQLLRASEAVGDAKTANETQAKILNWFPNGFIAQRSLLLSGQGMIFRQSPAAAQDTLFEFERRYPNSPLLPQVRLAIARTYEQEGAWSNAIAQYNDWLTTFTNKPAPQVEYYRAWANFQAGDETQALALFTNFVARFPKDTLTPSARWWIADHYFREGDYLSAEKNYQLVRQDSPGDGLAYKSVMMAGRSALARLSYGDATNYFRSLTSDANCPRSLRDEALFAWGDTLMVMNRNSTNKFADYFDAIGYYGEISQSNSLYAAALGKIGNCYSLMAEKNPQYFDLATNAYQQAVDWPLADVTTRSQAKIGLGVVAEKQAQQKSGEEQTALLKAARDNYLDVLDGNILHGGEKADPFWTRKAGLEAARICETLGEWEQAINLYRRLEELLPQWRASLERKITAAQKNLSPARE